MSRSSREPRSSGLRRGTRISGAKVRATILAALLVAGCRGGTLQDGSEGDTGGPADTVPAIGGDRLIANDLDVRTRDGAHRCGFFPDTCPDGADCYTVVEGGEIGRRCVRYRPGSRGDECRAGRVARCGDGRRCLNGTCRTICRPGGSGDFSCDPGKVCIRARVDGTGLSWGGCVERTDECGLWPNDDCPAGKNCYALDRGTRCLEFDSGAELGDRCGGSTDCNAAQVCVRKRGEESDGSVCRAKCDGDHPCDSGRCEAVSELEFGACLPAGQSG